MPKLAGSRSVAAESGGGEENILLRACIAVSVQRQESEPSRSRHFADEILLNKMNLLQNETMFGLSSFSYFMIISGITMQITEF